MSERPSRQPDSNSEDSFGNIEPADFRIPSRREQLIEDTSEVQRFAVAGHGGGRQRTRHEGPPQLREHHYRRSPRPVDIHRTDVGHREYRYPDRHVAAHADAAERESSGAYLINQVSSSAGESVGSQRYWPSQYDARSFDSHQPPNPSYSYRPSSQYPTPPRPTPPPQHHFHRQSAPRSAYHPNEEYAYGPPRHHTPYGIHDDRFRPLDHHQQEEYKQRELIKEINENDVICGRGGAANTHIGNRSFREFVKKHQARYLESKKKDKPAVAEFIVNHIKEMTPPGRFVKKDQETGLWYEVGDDRAREKASQALREGAAAKRREQQKEDETFDRAGSPITKRLGSADAEETIESAEEGRESEREYKTMDEATTDRKPKAMVEEKEKGDDTEEVGACESADEGDGSSFASSIPSDVSTEARVDAKRVVVLRPALELRRRQLPTLDVETLPDEDKAVYLDSFMPPTHSPSTVIPDTRERQV